MNNDSTLKHEKDRTSKLVKQLEQEKQRADKLKKSLAEEKAKNKKTLDHEKKRLKDERTKMEDARLRLADGDHGQKDRDLADLRERVSAEQAKVEEVETAAERKKRITWKRWKNFELS